MSSLPSPPPSPLLSPRKVPLSDTSASSNDEESIPTRRPLPKEVWSLIAEYVRVPMPARKEITERKQIRQVGLAQMMSVSKLVNNGTAPVLYRFIISDDLYSLFWGFNTDNIPSAPGVCSKAELLRFARTLYVEYPIRPMTDLHDLHLMGEDFHRLGLPPRIGGVFCGSSGHRPDASLAVLVEAEWLFLQNPQTQLQHSMPDLEVLCCGALFGTDEFGWRMCGTTIAGLDSRIEEVHKVFARMYRAGKVRSYCQSGVYSAFCLHPVELHLEPPPFHLAEVGDVVGPPFPISPTSSYSSAASRTITVHLTLSDAKRDYGYLLTNLPCLPGVDVRWCFEQPNYSSSSKDSGIPFLRCSRERPRSRSLYGSMIAGLAARHDAKFAYHDPPTFPLTPLMVSAYVPITNRTTNALLRNQIVDVPAAYATSEVDKQTWRRRCAVDELDLRIYTELFIKGDQGRLSHQDDSLELGYIGSCPECPGCRWLPKEEGETGSG